MSRRIFKPIRYHQKRIRIPKDTSVGHNLHNLYDLSHALRKSRALVKLKLIRIRYSTVLWEEIFRTRHKFGSSEMPQEDSWVTDSSLILVSDKRGLKSIWRYPNRFRRFVTVTGIWRYPNIVRHIVTVTGQGTRDMRHCRNERSISIYALPFYEQSFYDAEHMGKTVSTLSKLRQNEIQKLKSDV